MFSCESVDLKHFHKTLADWSICCLWSGRPLRQQRPWILRSSQCNSDFSSDARFSCDVICDWEHNATTIFSQTMPPYTPPWLSSAQQTLGYLLTKCVLVVVGLDWCLLQIHASCMYYVLWEIVLFILPLFTNWSINLLWVTKKKTETLHHASRWDRVESQELTFWVGRWGKIEGIHRRASYVLVLSRNDMLSRSFWKVLHDSRKRTICILVLCTRTAIRCTKPLSGICMFRILRREWSESKLGRKSSDGNRWKETSVTRDRPEFGRRPPGNYNRGVWNTGQLAILHRSQGNPKELLYEPMT
jgi:hypothetical protein